MSSYSCIQIVGWCAAVLALFLMVYRSSPHSHTQSHEQTATSRPLTQNALQCKLKRQPHRSYDHSLKVGETLLSLGSNESSLFPFPKSFSSNERSDHINLELDSSFQIRFLSHGHNHQDVNMIVNRFCTETVASTRSSRPGNMVIHDVEINFVETNLLATSEMMQSILANRVKEAKDNAAYIDAEMYTLDISTDGVARIQTHSPLLYPGSHRGLANALASLEQLVHQAVSVQVPLSIVDWPDNHWRGE